MQEADNFIYESLGIDGSIGMKRKTLYFVSGEKLVFSVPNMDEKKEVVLSINGKQMFSTTLKTASLAAWLYWYDTMRISFAEKDAELSRAFSDRYRRILGWLSEQETAQQGDHGIDLRAMNDILGHIML